MAYLIIGIYEENAKNIYFGKNFVKGAFLGTKEILKDLIIWRNDFC